MDYTITAKKLMEQLGGKENVASLTHCMTRLRFVLKDESGIDDKMVEEIQKMLLFVLFRDEKEGKTAFFHAISLIYSVIFIVFRSRKGMHKGTK